MSVPEVPDAPLTVAAVAARLGVAASTLRTWDRRYGLGPSSHEMGAHRRYTRSDVARLEHMRSLTLQGVAPSDAAQIALADTADAGREPEPAPPKLSVVSNQDLLADPLTLVAAALDPDQTRTARIVGCAVDRLGVLRAWAEVVRPALRILRDKPRADRAGVEPDAMVAAALASALRSEVAGSAVTADAAVGVVSGPDSVLHGQVVAAALTQRGANVYLLRPASTDGPDELLEFARSLRVRAIAVSGDATHATELMGRVSEAEDLAGYLIGSHATDVWLPRVHRVRTVPAAVEEIAAYLGL